MSLNTKNTEDKVKPDSKKSLRKTFETHSAARNLVIRDIESRVERVLASLTSHLNLKVRIKQFNSYYKKYLHILRSSGKEPRITDLIGIRIICPFVEDLKIVETLIKAHFDVIETEQKGHFTFKEFGYESTHLLITIPADIIQKRGPIDCDVAEIQIRTILQDAWAEVEHELVYKAEFSPFDTPMKRKLAAVNASLSLADIIFQEIRLYQKQLHGQLDTRRTSFYNKVEAATDALLFAENAGKGRKEEQPQTAQDMFLPLVNGTEEGSTDDLLLKALYAHNENRFDDAITLYSTILEMQPDNTIRSLIFKHRGMAYFAQSNYQDAITDFSNVLDLDPKSYRAAYYRGLVRLVLKRYAEAIDDLTLSLEINPYQAFCLFRRSQAYFHVGDFPQALADCDASLALEADNENVEKFRSLILGKLKM